MQTSNYNKQTIISDYHIKGCTINSCKYLGVNITYNLSWNKHIANIVSKAHSVCGFLQRNLRQYSSSVKAKAYFASVRPTVEYTSVIWSPYTTCDITALEAVQCKAARFVCNDFLSYLSMTAMMNNLKWNSLEERRKQARLIMFYKIIYGIVQINFNPYLHPSRRARGYQNYRHLLTRINSYYHSFLPATICNWNCLPNYVIDSSNLNEFMNNLYMHSHKHTLNF